MLTSLWRGGKPGLRAAGAPRPRLGGGGGGPPRRQPPPPPLFWWGRLRPPLSSLLERGSLRHPCVSFPAGGVRSFRTVLLSATGSAVVQGKGRIAGAGGRTPPRPPTGGGIAGEVSRRLSAAGVGAIFPSLTGFRGA